MEKSRRPLKFHLFFSSLPLPLEKSFLIKSAKQKWWPCVYIFYQITCTNTKLQSQIFSIFDLPISVDFHVFFLTWIKRMNEKKNIILFHYQFNQIPFIFHWSFFFFKLFENSFSWHSWNKTSSVHTIKEAWGHVARKVRFFSYQ